MEGYFNAEGRCVLGEGCRGWEATLSNNKIDGRWIRPLRLISSAHLFVTRVGLKPTTFRTGI